MHVGGGFVSRFHKIAADALKERESCSGARRTRVCGRDAHESRSLVGVAGPVAHMCVSSCVHFPQNIPSEYLRCLPVSVCLMCSQLHTHREPTLITRIFKLRLQPGCMFSVDMAMNA